MQHRIDSGPSDAEFRISQDLNDTPAKHHYNRHRCAIFFHHSRQRSHLHCTAEHEHGNSGRHFDLTIWEQYCRNYVSSTI
jgi:uncharacterized protein (DUF2461 family)